MERVELWEEQQAVAMELEVALGYVKAVKQALSATAYAQFLDVLRAYRQDNLTSVDVKTKCDLLFSKHPQLAAGLESFLPRGSADEGPPPQAAPDAQLAPTPVYMTVVGPHGLCSAFGDVEGGDAAPLLSAVQGDSRRRLRSGAH